MNTSILLRPLEQKTTISFGEIQFDLQNNDSIIHYR